MFLLDSALNASGRAAGLRFGSDFFDGLTILFLAPPSLRGKEQGTPLKII